jgi:hypothetical protein
VKHKDANGEQLLVGDTVVLLAAPATLLANLPEQDQAAIKEQVGKSLGVAGFDKYGYVELTEFTDSDGTIHTIWVEPEYLRKVASE